MSETRIVVERACPVHGLFDQPSHTAYGGCIGSRRRVLTAGEYLLVEKVDGEWPEWVESMVGLEISDDITHARSFGRDFLNALTADALAKSEQDNP